MCNGTMRARNTIATDMESWASWRPVVPATQAGHRTLLQETLHAKGTLNGKLFLQQLPSGFSSRWGKSCQQKYMWGGCLCSKGMLTWGICLCTASALPCTSEKNDWKWCNRQVLLLPLLLQTALKIIADKAGVSVNLTRAPTAFPESWGQVLSLWLEHFPYLCVLSSWKPSAAFFLPEELHACLFLPLYELLNKKNNSWSGCDH